MLKMRGAESESESESKLESIRIPESEPESEQPHHDSPPLLKMQVPKSKRCLKVCIH